MLTTVSSMMIRHHDPCFFAFIALSLVVTLPSEEKAL
jgi:hypothetical protein